MSDLIERLKQSEGPDRELDAAIWQHFGYTIKRFNAVKGERFLAYPPEGSQVAKPARQALTSSLDAALALVEEVLDFEELPQGSQLLIERYTEHNLGDGKFDVEWMIRLEVWRSYARPGMGRDRDFINARHASPAAALLIALLQAVQATGETGS